MIKKTTSRWLILSVLTLILSGCATLNQKQLRDGPPHQSVDINKIHDPIPHPLKVSKYGNPPTYRVNGINYHVMNSAKGYHQRGIASWYGTKFHGQRTSSGEPYNMFAMTAANRTLPIPVFARVTNLENGRSVIVKINDRGPFAINRIIDLSYVAAKKLGYANKGTAMVDVQALTFDKREPIRMAEKTIEKRYVQVGAFRNPDNAKKLRIQLARYTQKPVSIQTLKNHREALYRVQIGPFAGKAEFNKLLERLKPLGLKSKITVS